MLALGGFVIEMLFELRRVSVHPRIFSDLLAGFSSSISYSVAGCWCELLDSALSHVYENRLLNVLSLCHSKTISASSTQLINKNPFP